MVDTKSCIQKSLLVLEEMIQVIAAPVTPVFIVRSERERDRHHRHRQGVYNSNSVLLVIVHVQLVGLLQVVVYLYIH